MPIYSYACETCKTKVEKLQKLNEAAPECGTHGPMQKLFTVPAFKFKNGQGTDMGNSMAVPGFSLPPV